MSIVDLLIPTWNNPQYLFPCLDSIIKNTGPEDFFHIYVVNNGTPESVPIPDNPHITVLQQERNLGWEGGLKAGLEASKAPYVVFMNDDTFVPHNQKLWLNRLLGHMSDPNCAASGPSSNVVMGKQQMFLSIYDSYIRTKFLIGFCMLVRRSDLDAVGGIDMDFALTGGDDLDLSIRFRNSGKYLLADREVFIYHHGFKTGERVEGTPQAGGWNSLQKIERTNFALINKHGLPAFLDLWTDQPSPASMIPPNWGDNENELVKKWATGEKVAELGCGDKKLFDHSVGIDIIPKGQEIHGLSKGRKSLADITANVQEDLPIKDFDTVIAQHILEHCVDAVGAVQAWRKALKHGGRLIVAVPDQTLRNSIPMNIEHVHAWTPNSLKRFMESQGWKTVDLLDPKNNVSFIGVFSKNGNHS